MLKNTLWILLPLNMFYFHVSKIYKIIFTGYISRSLSTYFLCTAFPNKAATPEFLFCWSLTSNLLSLENIYNLDCMSLTPWFYLPWVLTRNQLYHEYQHHYQMWLRFIENQLSARHYAYWTQWFVIDSEQLYIILCMPRIQSSTTL